MSALDGAIGPLPPSLNRASSAAGRRSGMLSGGRSSGSIYGSPGGSGPLIRAGLLVLAVIILLVLVAKNCTGSDGSDDVEFEESVTAGVASIDPEIVVAFDGKDVTLSGEVADENTRLNAQSQAVLAGAENVTNDLTVAVTGSFTSTDPAVAGALQTAIDDIVTAAPITFDSGSTEITEASAATLDQVAAAITASPGGVVLIVGHTDSLGEPESNLEISRDRANSVRVYLVDAGVDPLRINSEGRGDTEPIADNETEEGRAENRRIEFLVQ